MTGEAGEFIIYFDGEKLVDDDDVWFRMSPSLRREWLCAWATAYIGRPVQFSLPHMTPVKLGEVVSYQADEHGVGIIVNFNGEKVKETGTIYRKGQNDSRS